MSSESEASKNRQASPYRIPTHEVEAELHIEGREALAVTLYLGTLSETHAGPERIEEALNRPRDFIPVRSSRTSQNFLVRRRSIRFVRVLAEEGALGADEPGLVSCAGSVVLELKDGSLIEGSLAAILPPESSRLSDYFNLEESAFVPLTVDDGVAYVNKEFIDVVRLSESEE